MKFYFHIVTRLYIFILIEQLPIKLKFLSEKKEKFTDLQSILIFELNQMNSDKVIDGRAGFAV